MKNKKQEANEMQRRDQQTLAERIADQTLTPLAPQFIEWLRDVAFLNGGMSEDVIYQMWRKHVKQNDAMDQSPTKSEFCQWNNLKDSQLSEAI